MGKMTSWALVEVRSIWRETTTSVTVATWRVREAMLDFRDREGGAMEASNSHCLSSGGAGKVLARRSLELEAAWGGWFPVLVEGDPALLVKENTGASGLGVWRGGSGPMEEAAAAGEDVGAAGGVGSHDAVRASDWSAVYSNTKLKLS